MSSDLIKKIKFSIGFHQAKSKRYPFDNITVNSAQFDIRDKGGNATKEIQIQNSKNTMKDHGNHIKEMIKFIEIKHPIYALQVISKIWTWIHRTIDIISLELRKILTTKKTS